MAASNVLEFYVRMKDLMSSGLVTLARNANSALNQVQTAVNNTIRANDQLAASYTRAEKASTSSSNTLLSNAKRVAAAVGVAAIGASMMGFAKDSVQAALRNDMQKQSFGILTGNRGIGDELAGQLNKLQQDTVLGPGVFKNAQTMLGFGIGGEEVMPALKMLGDISMGDANRMEALTLAFSQVRAAGKLTGQDLLQFVNAGFNPLNEIAKATGKSMGQLKEEMADGKISFTMVQQAIEKATGTGGTFNKMLDKMGSTTGGKIQQVSGAVEALKINIGTMLKPIVDDTVTSFAKFVEVMRKATEMPVAMQVQDQITQIKMLQSELTSANTGQERRLQILKELEQINPNITAGINAESIEYGKLASNITNVVNALNQKKIASEIENENLGVITKYNRAKEQQANAIKEASKMIAQVPGLAERTDLTQGQKQLEAIKYFNSISEAGAKNAVNGGNLNDVVKGVGGVLLAETLKGHIREANKQGGTASSLSPQVNQVQAQIKNAMATYNSMFGIKEMKTAQGLSPSGFSTASAGGTNKEAKETASRATSGGPRVINISGVTMKLAEHMTVQANSADDLLNGMEPKMKEMWMRILQGSAAMQNS